MSLCARRQQVAGKQGRGIEDGGAAIVVAAKFIFVVEASS